MTKKYIYIVLMTTETLASKSIKHLTNDAFTHASISLDEGLSQMYSFGRHFTYLALYCGFKQEYLHKGLYGTYTNLPGAVIKVEVTSEQYLKVNKMLDHFIINSRNYSYNYAGLLYAYANKEFNDKNRFLCSEFVYHVLYESGILDLSKPANLVRPKDFLCYKDNIIFEGNIKDLQTETYFRKGKVFYIKKLISNIF